MRIKPTVDNVLQVVRSLGIEDASDEQKLHDLFAERFIETLKSVARRYDYATLSDREFFKSRVMDDLGDNLDGYMLDVVTIDEMAKSVP